MDPGFGDSKNAARQISRNGENAADSGGAGEAIDLSREVPRGGFIPRFLFSIVKRGRRGVAGKHKCSKKNSKSIKHITLLVPYIFVP